MDVRFRKAFGILLFIFGAARCDAQAPPVSLEKRLDALEQRIALLEAENRQLKAELDRVVPRRDHQVTEAAPQPEPVPTKVVAQTQNPPSEMESKKPERVELGGHIRFRGEVRQNVDLSAQKSDVREPVYQRVRFHARLRASDKVEGFFEFQDARLWGQEISSTSNDNLTDLHQGYLQVRDFFVPGLTLKAGRQEFIYGSERLIGAFSWDNIGRSFDALKVGYSSRTWWSDWFAAKTVDRPGTGRGDRDQYLYGAYNQFFRERPQHLEIYGILFRDGLRTAGEVASMGPSATEILTLGFRSDGKVDPGINYELEFANQFGHRGPDSHSARAFAAKVYKTVREGPQVRFGFEYDRASGNRDPKDGKSGEFLNLFPTNHLHYGYADLMGWRNMQDFRGMFVVTPRRQTKFDVDYHRLYLLEARGPWKDAGGALLGFDPTGQSGTHVGDEVDFTLAFPLFKSLKMLSGYALFVPGEFAKKTRGSAVQHFVYLQTQVDF